MEGYWLSSHECTDEFEQCFEDLKAETLASKQEKLQLLRDSEAVVTKIRDLQHRICRLENQLEFLKSERDVLQRDLKHRDADLKSLQRESEKKLEAIQEKNFQLGSRLQEANTQCASLLERIAELHDTNTRMERDLRIAQHLLELERNANSKAEVVCNVANVAVSTDDFLNAPSTLKCTTLSTEALYISATPTVKRRFVNSVHCSVDLNNNDDFVARSLWISGLTRETKASDLKMICKEFGKFVRAKVFERQRSLTCFGFVTMGDVAAAERAIAALNTTQINGSRVSVQKANTLDNATLETLTSAKTVKNGEPCAMNVTIDEANASFTVSKEDSSKEILPSRCRPRCQSRTRTSYLVTNTSGNGWNTPPEVSPSESPKSNCSVPLLSAYIAPAYPEKASERRRTHAEEHGSNSRCSRSSWLAREEEALRKERERLDQERRELEEHRRKVQLQIIPREQKLKRASSSLADSHSSQSRSRSRHTQLRPRSKVSYKTKHGSSSSSHHRYPIPIDRRISRERDSIRSLSYDRLSGRDRSWDRHRSPSASERHRHHSSNPRNSYSSPVACRYDSERESRGRRRAGPTFESDHSGRNRTTSPPRSTSRIFHRNRLGSSSSFYKSRHPYSNFSTMSPSP